MKEKIKEQTPSPVKMQKVDIIKAEELEALRKSPANPLLPESPTLGDWEERGVIRFVEKKDYLTNKSQYYIESLNDAELDVRDSLANFRKTASKGNS